ncbi:MAG: hypothetical protein K2P99_01935 [Burkholderiales bacterium]|nr:hypothetical protein [Burkholderiales bacterium]
MNNINANDISVIVDSQVTEKQKIIRKISFKKETLRNLVTVASREYFDTKMKQDEMLSEMLDTIINDYYDSWKISKK